MTLTRRNVVMPFVADPADSSPHPPCSVAMMIDPEAFERFGRTLRHLAIGLVDQAVPLRLVSSDPRVESLLLGPVQALIHERLVFPSARRRLERLIDSLSAQPPSLVHAMSSASYRAALTAADELDADVVLQVTSLADCEEAAALDRRRVRAILAFTEPLRQAAVAALGTNDPPVEWIRAGVPTAQHATCFAEAGRVATLLCTAALQHGYGVAELIQGLHGLQKRGAAPLTFLVGQGPLEGELRKMVRRLALSGVVTFAQPLGDSTAALRAADFFIQPAAESEFTADSLHALGAGMLVIAAPGGVDDHLHPGQTALRSHSATPESLAAAIEEALLDPARSRGIAISGMEYARRFHSMSAMADATAAVYRRIALSSATFPLDK